MSIQNLKASITNLIGYRTGQLFDAMLRATLNTTKLIKKNLQCKLLSNIKRCGIGTNDIEYLVKRMNISDNAKKKVRNLMMNEKIKDSYKKKYIQRAHN